VKLRDEVNAVWGIEPGLPASLAYPGNIIVSAFEAIDKENQLVVISAWKSEEIFRAYRQMRRDTAPSIVQPFLVDEVTVENGGSRHGGVYLESQEPPKSQGSLYLSRRCSCPLVVRMRFEVGPLEDRRV
jgi:hypothetical protein